MRIPVSDNNHVDFVERRVGLEFENPLVTVDGGLVEAGIIQHLYSELKRQGWSGEKDKLSGNILSVEKKINGRNAVISTDTSWTDLEFSLPPADSLHDAKKVWDDIRSDTLRVLGGYKTPARLLGIGMVPGHIVPDAKRFKTTKPMYRVIPHLYYHNLFLPLTSHQVGVSVKLSEAIHIVNTLNKVSAFIVALSANSSITDFSVLPWKEWRMFAWRMLLNTNVLDSQKFALYPERPFTSLADYYKYYWDVGLMAFSGPIKKDEFTLLEDTIGWHEYFTGTSWSAHFPGGKKFEAVPGVEDLNMAAISHWPFAKLHIIFDEDKINIADFLQAFDDDSLEAYISGKYSNIYIEYRAVATQPKGEEMSIPSLMLGLVNNINDADAFLQQFTWKACGRLIDDVSVAGMDAEFMDKGIAVYLKDIIDVAKNGLLKRNMGEEKYLDVLYKRVEDRMCPADEMNRLLTEKGKDIFLDSITY